MDSDAHHECLVVLFYAYFPTPLSVEAADALRSAQEAAAADNTDRAARIAQLEQHMQQAADLNSRATALVADTAV